MTEPSSVKLYGPESDFSVFSGTGKINLTGGRFAALCEALTAVLRGENEG